MILTYLGFRIINLLRGMCTIFVSTYMLSLTPVIGSFKLRFIVHFD